MRFADLFLATAVFEADDDDVALREEYLAMVALAKPLAEQLVNPGDTASISHAESCGGASASKRGNAHISTVLRSTSIGRYCSNAVASIDHRVTGGVSGSRS